MTSELPSISALAFLFSPTTEAGSPGQSSGQARLLRWLVGAAKPRLLVDLAPQASSFLGTYCDSVAHWGLDSRCVAVRDATERPSEGSDAAAKPRSPEVLVLDRHAAARDFRAGSVDLLHLSGLGTPERLVELYDSWTAKLSTRAVVVVGGIRASGGGTGVRELWQKLRASHPQVSLGAGCGLGIAAVGSNVSGAIRQLTSLPYHELRSVLDIFEEARSGEAASAEAVAREEPADMPAPRIAGNTRRLEEVGRPERERTETSEIELRQMRQTGTWRFAQGLRDARSLVGWRNVAPRSPVRPSLPIAEDRAAQMRQALAEQLRAFLLGTERISFQAGDQPQVSVVIPVSNQAELTLACLRSLLLPRRVGLDVVIVDSASSDDSAKLFARLDGVTVISNPQDVGFLEAVKQGVAASRGTHLLLLSNDATLRPGSLEAALETLESQADIGAIGGPVVLRDGLLQEAGSIIWADGRCAQYGRGRQPTEPEFQFRRDVDCCSGAFLLIARRRWDELGGFDSVYSLSHYAEADLCMRLRQQGLRVVYEPRAVVDRLQFSTADETGWTEMQIRNAVIFRNRHAAALDQLHHRAGTPLLKARAQRSAKQRVLVIDDAVPHPSRRAAHPRPLHLLEALVAAGREVTLLPLDTAQDDWSHVYDTLPPTVEVMLGTGRSGLAGFLAQRAGHYDVVLVRGPRNMSALNEARTLAPGSLAGALLVYDAEALFSARDLMKSRLAGERLSQEALRARIAAEAGLVRTADRILAVSEQEAVKFRKLNAGRVLVLPPAVSVRPTPRQWPERSGFLFVGRLTEMGSPDLDALRWFCGEVLPRIRQAQGVLDELYVAGEADARAASACKGGRLLGVVPDLWDLYDRCRVFVAPTRFAAGIPHEVYEAAAHGIPIVATSLLAGQLAWQHDRDLLVADDPKEFAACVSALTRDRFLWERLRASALQRVRDDCSEQKFRRTLEAALTPDEQLRPAEYTEMAEVQVAE